MYPVYVSIFDQKNFFFILTPLPKMPESVKICMALVVKFFLYMALVGFLAKCVYWVRVSMFKQKNGYIMTINYFLNIF